MERIFQLKMERGKAFPCEGNATVFDAKTGPHCGRAEFASNSGAISASEIAFGAQALGEAAGVGLIAKGGFQQAVAGGLIEFAHDLAGGAHDQ